MRATPLPTCVPTAPGAGSNWAQPSTLSGLERSHVRPQEPWLAAPRPGWPWAEKAALQGATSGRPSGAAVSRPQVRAGAVRSGAE